MSAHAPLIELLSNAAQRIRSIEAEANAALHDKGDEAAYRALMAEKCSLLMDLPERAEPLLPGAPHAGRIEAALDSYAVRAGQALDLDSVFYQAALLYPDDYKDGEDNEIETFIRSLGE